MLKVLYLPLNDLSNTQQATYDAWNNVGVDLKIYDFHKIWLKTKSKEIVAKGFLNAVNEFKPKLIHMQIQFTGLLSKDILREARELSPGVIITNWTGDCRANPDPGFVALSEGCDYSLISSTGQINKYKDAGCKNVKYWQIGYDPKVFFPKNYSNFKYDVSFAANHYNHFPESPLRKEIINSLYYKYKERFGIFGFGHSIPSKSIPMPETNEVYNSSICALSISNFNDVAHYFSDRLLTCLASGRPTICWNFPNYESYFVDGQDLIIVNSFNEINGAIEFCKNNPEKANEIGKNGYKKVLMEHTYTSKIMELLNILNLMSYL